MILPFFIERTAAHAVRKWGGRTEAFTNSLAIILAVFVIFLAICSVTKVVHTDASGKETCTTLLGENTDCHKE